MESGSFSESFDIKVKRNDIMPGMRAYLSRAGYSSLLSDVPRDIIGAARDIYTEALELAEPSAFVACCKAEEISSIPLPNELLGCRSYSFMLFSLGAALDSAVEEAFAAEHPLRALLLDSWGSEAVEALASNIDTGLRAAGGEGSRRFAPGYSGFDVRNNFGWLNLIKSKIGARGGRIGFPGISADPDTGIIVPRKSIVCAIGWKGLMLLP